jgi:hypothetical protein
MLHRTLWSVFTWAEPAWTRTTGQRHLVVTCVWRSQQETNELYAAAGLPAPLTSVHATVQTLSDPFSGVRGIDLSARDADAGLASGKPYEQWPLLDRELLNAFAAAVNGAWRYQPEERYQVALVHSVNALHVHLQVARGDTTRRRGLGGMSPDPTTPAVVT